MNNTHHMNLRPDTSWQMRRYIRKIEAEAERLHANIYRLGVLLEVIIIILLLICDLHYRLVFF